MTTGTDKIEELAKWHLHQANSLPYSTVEQFHRTQAVLLRSLSTTLKDLREKECEDVATAWLIVRQHPNGKETREIVLSPLTDETYLPEGDEAFPLYAKLGKEG